ncbi:scarecrow-like protein 30 [Coffea eugenioides]|uniref:scarecrow-like protein 30 n=1 Tax=Coffea eugenioides TaxID=49369 RepID=UPI000F61053F|nr:scarecrow-like protein 30 [Coffea eugenioides]
MDHQFLNLNGSGSDGTVVSSLEQSELNFQLQKVWDPVKRFGFNDGIVFGSLDPEPLDPSSFAPFFNVSTEVDFPDEHECYPVLKHINQMLMEENLEEQQSMSTDPLALQAAEKSLYEILGKNYPHSPRATFVTALENNAHTPDCFSESSSNHVANCSDSGSNSAASWPIPELSELSGKQGHHLVNSCKSSFHTNSVQCLHMLKNSTICGNGQVASLTDENLIPSFYSNHETMMLFKRGLEEGKKFLPSGNQLVVDLDKHTLSLKLELLAEKKKDEVEKLAEISGGRKHQNQDDDDSLRGRSNKQSATSEEEVELSELLDRVLLHADSKGLEAYSDVDVEQPNGSFKTLSRSKFLHRSRVGMSPEKRLGAEGEALDLFGLLISCAQFVAADDHRTATEKLKQIRQHASCLGDPHQRLAFILVNALEARLAGTGRDLHVALTSKRISTADQLKAYRVYLCSPLRPTFSFFANEMILEAASRATILHIVDFGITFGFQWPTLIQQLSNRDGGPPKLRITGIDFPQPGFRPAESMQQTGHRLAKYCERFNVPFEYQAIATRNWDKITIEELKLTRNEVLAVACQFGLKNISDDMVEGECPRDAVLSLIRAMNPDILVTDVLSAQLSGPFFLTRFRDALSFFLTMFDAIDNNLPRKDAQRMKFEQEFLGTQLLNIVACEGLARVERCETYRKWHARYNRAGFRQLPLNQDLLKELRGKVKKAYHKDFMLDEDGCWMLQGWKGKIISACSCWIPA